LQIKINRKIIFLNGTFSCCRKVAWEGTAQEFSSPSTDTQLEELRIQQSVQYENNDGCEDMDEVFCEEGAAGGQQTDHR
jgi:hypothetical protein